MTQRLSCSLGSSSVHVLVIAPCLDGGVVRSQQGIAGFASERLSEPRPVVVIRGVNGVTEGLDKSLVKLVYFLERLTQLFSWAPSLFQRLTERSAAQIAGGSRSGGRALR
ncbi:hypothetical protein [Mycobacterium avium]|uniref:hypothetical protein n=1 Tax=Mycobacterium avium TaxID=1764 RepID=UPI000B4B407F|nr:hypothetical protein [Mycobacterium avium]